MSIIGQYDDTLLNELAQTVLYEGYALYPYHTSALKNKKPAPFGVIFPHNYTVHHCDADSMTRTQCILHAGTDAKLSVTVRFLQLVKVELFRKVGEDFVRGDELTAGGNHYSEGWQAIERQVCNDGLMATQLPLKKSVTRITYPASVNAENIIAGKKILGKRIFRVAPASGCIEIDASVVPGDEPAWRITVRVSNTTVINNPESTEPDEALCRSFIAAHTILKTDTGEFISEQNTPEKWRAAVAQCKNRNTWPVLMDEENRVVLSSPIVLYDYPLINSGRKDELPCGMEPEDALWMHVNVLAGKRAPAGICDHKARAMIEKANGLAPG